MIEQVDQRLEEWATTLIPGVDISLDPPNVDAKGRRVGVYLLELLQSPAPVTVKRAPLQLSLRYLITTWADTPKDAHKMLGDLMLAAMDDAEMQVELEPVSLAVWNAFGTPPRPSFMLRLPMRRERPEPAIKPVLSPMIVRSKPLSSFCGLLLGRPGDLPLADVAIEVPSLRLLTRSDRHGRFTFPTVPSEMPLDMRIRAKGREFRLQVDGTHRSPDNPLVIPLDLLEG
jgi:hypothetical protein